MRRAIPVLIVALALVALATSRAPAASSPGISIKQVRPADGAGSPTSKPAPKVITIIESSPADVEPAMRELIARARQVDGDLVSARVEREVLQELSLLLARGGPDAQRVIFDHWPLFKQRSSALMMTALASYYETNGMHES